MELWTYCMVVLLVRAPQHTSRRGHFSFLALCFGPGEEIKSPHFLLPGKG